MTSNYDDDGDDVVDPPGSTRYDVDRTAFDERLAVELADVGDDELRTAIAHRVLVVLGELHGQ